MDRIHEIAFLVLGALAMGGAVLLVHPVLTTVGISFYRTNGLVFLITFLLGLIIGSPVIFTGAFSLSYAAFFYLTALLILLFYNLRLWFRNPYSSPVLLFAVFLFGMSGILISLKDFAGLQTPPFLFFLIALHAVIGSLLLGAGTLAMLLGHSYLTRPTLSIVPLLSLSKLFMGLVFLEGLIAIVYLVLAAAYQAVMNAILLHSFEGLYLWIRFLIGMIGPMVLAPMIIKTVEERATMSATGLLYIAMLMVIIGALFSRFFILIGASFI
ncbi:MAG: hypothetical protein AAB035_06425 [Nitrospirota bacterium]